MWKGLSWLFTVILLPVSSSPVGGSITWLSQNPVFLNEREINIYRKAYKNILMNYLPCREKKDDYIDSEKHAKKKLRYLLNILLLRPLKVHARVLTECLHHVLGYRGQHRYRAAWWSWCWCGKSFSNLIVTCIPYELLIIYQKKSRNEEYILVTNKQHT